MINQTIVQGKVVKLLYTFSFIFKSRSRDDCYIFAIDLKMSQQNWCVAILR